MNEEENANIKKNNYSKLLIIPIILSIISIINVLTKIIFNEHLLRFVSSGLIYEFFDYYKVEPILETLEYFKVFIILILLVLYIAIIKYNMRHLKKETDVSKIIKASNIPILIWIMDGVITGIILFIKTIGYSKTLSIGLLFTSLIFTLYDHWIIMLLSAIFEVILLIDASKVKLKK